MVQSRLIFLKKFINLKKNKIKKFNFVFTSNLEEIDFLIRIVSMFNLQKVDYFLIFRKKPKIFKKNSIFCKKFINKKNHLNKFYF